MVGPPPSSPGWAPAPPARRPLHILGVRRGRRVGASSPSCSARDSRVVWRSSPRSGSSDARSREGHFVPACFGHDLARPSTSGTTRSTGANTARAGPSHASDRRALDSRTRDRFDCCDARPGRGQPLGSGHRSFGELHEHADPGRDALTLPAGERDHRRRARRGMLAPLVLAGISPARLGWSKLKGDLRPAVPLTAIVVMIWMADTGTMAHSFADARLWWDGLGVLAAVGAGFFLAVSLGLLASAYSPSPRVALLAGPALLFAWDSASPLLPEFIRLVWPQTSGDHYLRLWHLIGGDAGVHQHPHVSRCAIQAFTRRVGRLLGRDDDARRSRGMDRRRFPDVARAWSAGEPTRPDSPRTGVTPRIPAAGGLYRSAPSCPSADHHRELASNVPAVGSRVGHPSGGSMGTTDARTPSRAKGKPAEGSMNREFFSLFSGLSPRTLRTRWQKLFVLPQDLGCLPLAAPIDCARRSIPP